VSKRWESSKPIIEDTPKLHPANIQKLNFFYWAVVLYYPGLESEDDCTLKSAAVIAGVVVGRLRGQGASRLKPGRAESSP